MGTTAVTKRKHMRKLKSRRRRRRRKRRRKAQLKAKAEAAPELSTNNKNMAVTVEVWDCKSNFGDAWNLTSAVTKNKRWFKKRRLKEKDKITGEFLFWNK